MANQGRGLLRTSLGTEVLSEIPWQIRKQLFWSAGVIRADWLNDWYQLVTDLLEGKVDRGSARLAIKDQVDRSGYLAEPGTEGGLLDLSSDRRINLILDTQQQLANGWGRFEQENTEAVVQAFPARELYRAIFRAQPRNWAQKWMDAGGRTYGGRYIARVDDPIWAKSLSAGGFNRFGIPTGPFDFNSGMRTRPIGVVEAEQLGVIKPGDKLPKPMANGEWRKPNEVSRGAMSEAMKDALEKSGAGKFDAEGVFRPVS